jgi:hypothetical protein
VRTSTTLLHAYCAAESILPRVCKIKKWLLHQVTLGTSCPQLRRTLMRQPFGCCAGHASPALSQRNFQNWHQQADNMYPLVSDEGLSQHTDPWLLPSYPLRGGGGGVRGLEAIGGGCGSQLCANRWVLTAHLRYLCAVYGVGKSLPLCPGSRGDEHEARKSDLLHHHTHPFPLNFCAAPRASARLVWHPPLEQPATGPTLATGPCAQVGQLAKSSCLLFPVKR